MAASTPRRRGVRPLSRAAATIIRPGVIRRGHDLAHDRDRPVQVMRHLTAGAQRTDIVPMPDNAHQKCASCAMVITPHLHNPLI
jgi:hypothetical protein